MDYDYEKLGLKVGLEIHQQLNTKRKLFCNCPTKIRDDEPHGEIERFLRPSQSEMGQVDKAAILESRKEKKFIYQYYNDTTCLVELDDEPPHNVSEEGLNTALEVSTLMNMNFADEIHVMRKMVIDGSNTSGFQRTMFVSQDGFIETEYGKIRITSLCLEEDSCKKVEDGRDYTKYCVDRLGIPLLEITTEPDITSPKMGKEAARRIGTILRATGKVKRGLGTIRQDVNISIKNGARIEVKGVQNLDLIEKIIENEVTRQVSLNNLKEELIGRNAEVLDEIIDVTELLNDTESKVLRGALKNKGVIKAILLKGFSGLIGKEVQPGRRLGTEFSDRGKVLGGVGGLFHTDELPKYGITDEEVNKLKKFMNCGENDAVILVADAKNKAERALLAVIERAKESLIGIPEETRKALDDGNTSYLRPLPGAARMYPETDVPKILITSEICERIKNNLPEMPEEKTIRFIKEYELNEDLAKQMVMSYNVELFENLSKKYPNIKPTLIATTLEATLKEIKREGLDTEVLTDEHLNELFLGLSEDKMSKEAIPEVIKGYINNPNMKLDEVLDVAGLSKMSKEEVEAVILDIINQNILIVNEKGMGATGLLMGRCMAQLRGKADGKLINVTLQNKLKEKVQGQ
ncbi:putative aspartyl-tRNA(Asn) amidotransferase, B subunit [Methanococcus vannielii SB]|jgi:glutamyl-tRNA(Gln) amidotransferase subunit E|uniref:Glutamyl-tRNA(Gln) amidotransferase subunit E n=1 Tax=Methanococcus vannielii (strain ATCC 35089 / DSM 1224 / JCM 13029 / OCM 148 / SB) TaxID=406327 RepID=GATE_METVS|nr:Glu-tRNA(Gln) amidotransferase subunit GatE [Methanococcus vannielii]A6UPR3.1 RecName: Full=Glutamyl-tRNA(Gln) amidotransferase subunit E; Short=Glu-ADT subunit E [Methanococcus vannielii SB]ABR54485.1 putative aspartyl-tRNA(Asn) amidotransferase, B subunit [Methanococcus vannielii SB]